VLSWLLAEQGFDASIAYPPKIVDQTLRWLIPDVLLIDGDDDDLAGIVRRIRREERYAAMRIIAATHADTNTLGRIPEGADDYVSKLHSRRWRRRLPTTAASRSWRRRIR
jgi:DNA-binding response OmpR family regulator